MSMNVSSTYNSASVGGQYLRNGNDKKQVDVSNPENKIHEEAVKVEISSEGLKALKDEEKIAFLQQSLQKACDLYRIEPGSDLRAKYGYVSTGERMKEYAPEKYAELSTILEEAFETNSVELYQKAAKYMVDWEKSFVQPDKAIESEIVHYDKKSREVKLGISSSIKKDILF